jgi:hypothetical protein
MTAISSYMLHKLEPLKGYINLYAVDYTAKVSANVTIDFYQGRVGTLNSSYEFETGVGGHRMPLFVEETNTNMNITAPTQTGVVNAMGRGYVSALVSCYGYELFSTEYDSAKSYAANSLLTATVANTTQATGGVLTSVNGSDATLTIPYKASSPTTLAIVGVVSRAASAHPIGKANGISVWSVYFPAAA